MNIAYRFRIYPNREQEVLLAKTFGCCRFLYNQMLNDKIREYEATKKMLRNTPAMYKKAYPFLKEVDSLALANVQMHLEKAYKNFFRNPKIGFPKFKSKHRSRKSYTTNVVNGNIQVADHRIKLPKLKWIRMKKHRDILEKYCLKSVTISMEPSGKYYASLLYEKSDCEWIENDHFHVKTRYGILGIGNDAVIGDCGHTDAEGLFYFDGRDDDICNINGRKVSSLRVEEAVRTFPGVAETAVKAVHEHGRDYLKVWIVWEKEAEREEIAGSDSEKSGCTNMAIREFLAERLADYEIPREFVFLKEFPKTESGKIRKKEL